MTINLGEAVPLGSAVVVAAVAILGVVGYQNRRTKLSAIRAAFSEVIGLLAAENVEHRLAAAILLRRFMDPSSELGVRNWTLRRRAPYAKETQSVIAAVLRGLQRGDLQKLLADSLSYAASLENADLQRTNLQGAYLSPRRRRWRRACSLAKADFYRADLSGASLRGVCARAAVFYQARLQDTVLRDADLKDANFFEADLSGANFGGALLCGASFGNARNIPGELLDFLDDDNRYTSSDRAPAPTEKSAESRRVFVSAPTARTPIQDSIYDRVMSLLRAEGLTPETLPPQDYPPSGALSEIARRFAGCAGAVVLGFRGGNFGSDAASMGTTPWTHVEAGMAVGQRLPLLILRESGVDKGAFDDAVGGHRTHVVDLGEVWDDASLRVSVAPWVFEVVG